MPNDFEEYKMRDSNDKENTEITNYGPEIKHETYSQFYFRKFKRDFVYCKVTH